MLEDMQDVKTHGVSHVRFGGSLTARYRRAMSTVLEIERAIKTLPPENLRSLAESSLRVRR
jgi:hypothetical protein